MTLPSRFFGLVWLAALGALSGSSQAPPPVPPAPKPPPAAAASAPTGESTPGVTMIQELLVSLGKFQEDGKPEKQKLGFEIPERALNEYLAYSLRNRPRPGIAAMTVTLLPKNQISSEVQIDFDTVQKWDPEIFPEVLRPILSGKRKVKAEVQFESANGSCNFSLKDAMGPDGKAIANKIMAVMQALGSRQPESYDTAKPIPLPFGLKRIWTEKQLLCGET